MSKIIGKHIALPGKKAGYDSTIASGFAIGANDFHAFRIYNSVKQRVSKIGLLYSPVAVSAGGKIIVGIFSASGSNPGTKLVQSAEYTTLGTEAGKLIFIDLQNSIELNANTEYYITYHSNITPTYEKYHNFGAGYGYVFQTVTYNATMPSSFGATTTAGGMAAFGVY